MFTCPVPGCGTTVTPRSTRLYDCPKCKFRFTLPKQYPPTEQVLREMAMAKLAARATARAVASG